MLYIKIYEVCLAILILDVSKSTDRMANSVDPDLGLHCFAQIYLSK